MEKSPNPAQNARILRVGIIQNGQIVEERILRTREPVTIGQKLKNTFVLASGNVADSFTIFDVKSGNYQLRLPADTTGRVSLGDGVLEVGQLAASGRAQRVGDVLVVNLPDTSRGKVQLGDATVLFLSLIHI